MLLVGTVFWGFGYAWSKEGADGINRAAGADLHSLLGPMLVLMLRFGLGGIIWMIIFPAARTGWTWAHFRSAVILGFLLALQMTSQVLGLLFTGASIAAFLTSLTVLFVPLILTLALRKPPGLGTWIGVLLATLGVWLMTGASGGHFGIGELLGLGSALGCSVYLLTVNHLVPRAGVDRMAAGQFLVCGILCAIVLLPLRNQLPTMRALLHETAAIRDIALLTLLPTLLAYGLLSHFQPRVDPTRAAILYLAEPIFAALYARATLGETMTSRQISGAALILVANGVVEVVAKRRASPVRSFAQEELGLGLEVHEAANARRKE